jgi:hypothetical protein
MIEAITTAQKEAFLNEYKGSLFEFLVASELWQFCRHRPHDSFALTLAQPQLDLLQLQEQWLRRLDSQLLRALPIMAKQVSQRILDDLLTTENNDIRDIRIIGENAAGKSDWNEGDILLYIGEEWRPISLKLCKSGAFVNTKSAGVKSFIARYFAYYFDSRPLDVRQFSQSVEFHFTNMSHQLHQQQGLEFQGSWQAWMELGLPTLPGQLANPQRQIVLQFYHTIIGEMRTWLERAFAADASQFIKALAPILGHGRKDMQQYICFYRHQGDLRYQVEQVLSFDHEWLSKQTATVEFLPARSDISSFEIQLKDVLLQIRLKPMNTFTVPALKVNCSVRYG